MCDQSKCESTNKYTVMCWGMVPGCCWTLTMLLVCRAAALGRVGHSYFPDPLFFWLYINRNIFQLRRRASCRCSRTLSKAPLSFRVKNGCVRLKQGSSKEYLWLHDERTATCVLRSTKVKVSCMLLSITATNRCWLSVLFLLSVCWYP